MTRFWWNGLAGAALLLAACAPEDPSEDASTDDTDSEDSESGESEEEESDTGVDDLPPDLPDEPEPFCCGCLCVDQGWSCSEDTCNTEDGSAIGLDPEAGFFQIDGGDYIVNGQNASVGHARVWYAFHPADENPEDRPLLVFFNGGPGSSTAPLFSYNTNPFTLDQEVTGGDPIGDTVEPWTQFGNLLHVDAPNTGFSYTYELEGGSQPPVVIDPDRDAAAFVKLLIRFLARHPELQDNPVMIVGESYGGVRAQLMLRLVLDYQDLEDGYYQDPELLDELTEHYANVFPETDGIDVPADRIAEQFSHQVLIQAVVAGWTQLQLPVPPIPPGCFSGGDYYQCDEDDGWTFGKIYEAASILVNLDVLTQAIGVDPTTIEWMHADQRTTAYGRGFVDAQEDALVDQTEMIGAFGELNDSDRYFVGYNPVVNSQHPQGNAALDSVVGNHFLFNSYFVDALITDAAHDRAVWGPNIPPALAAYNSWLTDAVHDTDPRQGVDRPGWIQIYYQPDITPEPNAMRELRFPHYAGSGHVVTLKEPGELLEDIEDWYAP